MVDEATEGKKELAIGWLYCFDDAARSKFGVFYIPQTSRTYAVCGMIAAKYNTLLPIGKFEIESKKLGEQPISSQGYPFSGRIYLYHEGKLSYKELGELEEIFARNKLSPVFRGVDYLQAQILKRAYERKQK